MPGMVAKYWFEQIARSRSKSNIASSSATARPDHRGEDDVVIAISQSGETIDTLAALRLAKEQGRTILGSSTCRGSSIARETDAGAYTHAGPGDRRRLDQGLHHSVTVLTILAMHVGHRSAASLKMRVQASS